MAFLSSSITLDLIAILTGLLVCIIAFYKFTFTYWKKKGVPEIDAPSIPFGSFTDLFTGKKSYGESFLEIYNKFKAGNHQYGGVYMFAKPIFIVIDPGLVKRVMQNDFSHFVNHGTFANEGVDPLTVHLFNMEDDIWKDWRTKLTPTFTAGKMKMMFETLVKTTRGLVELLDNAATDKRAIEIKDTTARFTTDAISSIAFGIECNSLKNPQSSFRQHGKRALEDPSVIESIKTFLQFVLPHKIFSVFKIRITNEKVEKFFMDVVKDTVECREKNNIYRKDFMHMLLQLRNIGKITDDERIKEEATKSTPHLTMEEVTAQCFLFFLAGFETSSTVSTFALYEMAKNDKIQDKLRNEIRTVLGKHDNKITYESIAEMRYLDQIIQESLRKYPPVPSLFRVCTKDYKVPNSTLVIERGTQVQIPILGIQRDPDYYPDPDKFDPDRFSDENKKARTPFTWLPFGEGPRICIGFRFGMIQAKVGIVTMILNSKLRVNNKTQEPLQYKTKGFITAAKEGIWLDVEKI